MKWMWFLILSLVMLGGCGRGNVHIASPADGQTLTLGSQQYSCIDVVLDNNDYSDATIEFRGTEVVTGEVTIQPGAGGPARICTQPAGMGGAGASSQSCTTARPCTIAIIATRGDSKDVRTVKVLRAGYGAAPTK